VGWGEKDEQTPSSLEAAVIREISDRTPLPAPAPAAPPAEKAAPSIVDTSALKARTLGAQPTPSGPVPSLPPDAVVPGPPSDERLNAAEPAIVSNPPPGDRASGEGAARIASEVKASDPDARAAEDVAARARADAAVLEASRESTARAWGNAASVAESSGRVASRGHDVPRKPVAPAKPADPGDESLKVEGKRGSSFGIGVLVALGAMAALVIGLQYGKSRIGEAAPPPGDPQVTAEAPGPEAPAAAAPAPLITAAATATAVLSAAPSPVVSAPPTSGDDLPLPPGIVVTPNQGLLDVETGGREAIFVDGVELGKGPSLRVLLGPGVHEVRQRVRGEWRIRFVLIRPSRRTRLPLSGWTR
jgi:hypothetical protein